MEENNSATVDLVHNSDLDSISEHSSFSDDEMELEDNSGNIIMVDNLPLLPEENIEKLVREIFTQFGVIKEDAITMPLDPNTHLILGYCTIEFNTAQEAELAKEKTNGLKLALSDHILSVSMFNDIQVIEDDLRKPPQTIPNANLQQWLTDGESRAQFLIRDGPNTLILWNDAYQSKPVLASQKSSWTESFARWSPFGTFLATLHKEGVELWGGSTTFNRLKQFHHNQVKLIDFSPSERFLMTCSTDESSYPRKFHMKVFDLRTEEVRRTFTGNAVIYVPWPVLRWGGGRDDKYFARKGVHLVHVYETETFGLVGGKSMKVENVADLSWSPTDSVLALYVPEMDEGNQPARVSLVQIPSKNYFRQRKLFRVRDCKMYWQSKGDYLALKADRYTQFEKRRYSSIEIFRMRAKGIPVESVKLNTWNDQIVSFAWEPKGHRFAVVHVGDGFKHNVSFYSMSGGQVSTLTSFDSKQLRGVFWSPTGRFVVLAGSCGQLKFYDVDELDTVAQAQNFKATHVEWDPSGRYVVTAVSCVDEMKNEYSVWSFNGKLLYRKLRDNLLQFSWRPRPRPVLTAKEEEQIARNSEKYSKKYEDEDDEDDDEEILTEEQLQKRKMKGKWIVE